MIIYDNINFSLPFMIRLLEKSSIRNLYNSQRFTV